MCLWEALVVCLFSLHKNVIMVALAVHTKTHTHIHTPHWDGNWNRKSTIRTFMCQDEEKARKITYHLLLEAKITQLWEKYFIVCWNTWVAESKKTSITTAFLSPRLTIILSLQALLPISPHLWHYILHTFPLPQWGLSMFCRFFWNTSLQLHGCSIGCSLEIYSTMKHFLLLLWP